MLDYYLLFFIYLFIYLILILLYNYIFPCSFLSPNPYVYPSLLSFKFMFSLFNKYIFLNITYSVLVKLPVWMLWGQAIWYWKTNQCVLPWGTCTLPAPCYCLLCTVPPVRLSLHGTLMDPLVLCLLSSHFSSRASEALCV